MAKTLLPPSISHSGAIFSDCRRYRYALWRRWDTSTGSVMFIGLNPSQAGAAYDDPTIQRMRMFAESWGFGSVYVLNLYGYMTPYPAELLAHTDPVGDNETWLKAFGERADRVVFAWGVHGHDSPQAEAVKRLFPAACCMGTNKQGSPKHPLYLRKDTLLQPYGG